MFKKLIAVVTFGLVAATGGQAGAVVIDSTSYTAAGCLGAANCVIDGATLTAGPAGATFAQSTFASQNGLGINSIVTAAPRAPEIQGDSGAGSIEAVAISFATAQIVTAIQLAHFYNPTHFAGDPEEIAIITAGALSGTLQVINDAGAFLLTGDLIGATVALLDADKGLWQLLNPFGSNPITNLSFTAANTPKDGDNSDYTIALVETSEAPEPTTLGLLGIGLLGLGLAGRRRRRSAVARRTSP